MRLFSSLYERVMLCRGTGMRHATWWASVLPSPLFPIPPDVMLAPMALAAPSRAWHFAFITTVASVLGGLFGYSIGVFAFELVEPVLKDAGYYASYLQARSGSPNGVLGYFSCWFFPIPTKYLPLRQVLSQWRWCRSFWHH